MLHCKPAYGTLMNGIDPQFGRNISLLKQTFDFEACPRIPKQAQNSSWVLI